MPVTAYSNTCLPEDLITYRNRSPGFILVALDNHTLRQMTLDKNKEEGKRLFILVGKYLYNSDINFTLPKKYKEEPQSIMLVIGAFLYQKHEEPIIQCFIVA